MGFGAVGLFWIYSVIWLAIIGVVVLIAWCALYAYLGEHPMDWLSDKVGKLFGD